MIYNKNNLHLEARHVKSYSAKSILDWEQDYEKDSL